MTVRLEAAMERGIFVHAELLNYCRADVADTSSLLPKDRLSSWRAGIAVPS